jgi:hypothetical protein
LDVRGHLRVSRRADEEHQQSPLRPLLVIIAIRRWLTIFATATQGQKVDIVECALFLNVDFVAR